MSLKVKPHSWTVTERVKGQTTGVANSGTDGTGHNITGQITPISAEAAYQQFGVEARNTFVALMDSGDARYHTIEAEVTYGTRTFKVAGDPTTYSGIGAADHAGVLLVEVKRA